MLDPWIVLAAAGLEALLGYPAALQRVIPHPVVLPGRALGALEARWNNPAFAAWQRKSLGIATLVIVGSAAGIIGLTFQHILMPYSSILIALLATVGLAQRSLYDHVVAVLKPLAGNDLPAARTAVGMIVGRDVAQLDDSGVAAAALESLAESFNDGVVAPVFWLAVGGLPGLFIYKAVNTADSIIGHKEPRWKDFGWCAARTDDLLNLIPARFAGVLIASAGRAGWRTMMRDANKHASPNAGWPEAAMAGALGIQLGGPTTYDGIVHSRPTFGTGPRATVQDLHKGLRLYTYACGLLWAMLALGGCLWRL